MSSFGNIEPFGFDKRSSQIPKTKPPNSQHDINSGNFNSNGNKNNNINRKRNFKSNTAPKRKDGSEFKGKKDDNRNKPNSRQSSGRFTKGNNFNQNHKPRNLSSNQPKNKVMITDNSRDSNNLFVNPEALGFYKKPAVRVKKPDAYKGQPRIIEPIPFVQDPWDKENQQKMLIMEQGSTDNQGLYEDFQKMREVERKKMEDLGLVDAENTRKDLNDAISFRGTCLDMCPTFERIRRALENNVKNLEKDPKTNRISREKAVKAFSRPAAGQPPPLPSDVRPPHILTDTLDYLIDKVLPKLPESHSFLWDRTRSIRQDFTYQNYFGPETIDCNEKIVRIHLVSLHIMAGTDHEYSQQQELEQFNKALQTLLEIYEDVRKRGGECPNEAEFRSYYLISHLRDSEVERQLKNLPQHILKDPLIELALKFRELASQNNIIERGYQNTVACANFFVRFFELVYSPETPFLLSCILETKFNEIRFYALKSMTRAYHTKDKPYDGERLTKMLGFDSKDKLFKFVEYYEVDVINGAVDLVNKEKLETKYKLSSLTDKPKLSQSYSPQLNSKINKPLAEFINSGNPNVIRLNKVKETKPEVATEAVKIIPPKPQTDDVKAGSFADFLSSSNVNSQGGFGFKATDQPKTIPSAQGKGFSIESMVNKSATDASSGGSTGFNFGSKPATDLADQPVFSFNSQPQPKSESPAISALVETKKPEIKLPQSQGFNFTPQTGIKESTPKFKFEAKPKEKPLVEDKQVVIPKPVEPPKIVEPPKPTIKRFVDHSKFEAANKLFTSELISSLIESELNRELPKLVKHENAQRERRRIITSLTGELYQAFLNEITHEASMEIYSESIYAKNLKRKAIGKIKLKAQNLVRNAELKSKKRKELNEINFGLKRVSSNTSNTSNTSISMTKRRKYDDSIDDIVNKRSEIEKLWKPLDLDKFIKTCWLSLNKLQQDKKYLDIKFLVVVENWKLNYSKWLNNKLGLKVNQTKSLYENIITTDKINMKITSLPGKEQLNKEFFQNTGLVMFECGLLEVGEFKDIKAKLKRDGLILNKILSMVRKYGYYKIQVMIVFWNITEEKISQTEMVQLLDFDKKDVLTHSIICDMSQDNINDTLIEGFNEIAHHFKHELSLRGKRKFEKSKSQEKKKINDDLMQKAETKILNKARLDKKYAYLNNHSFNRSMSNSMTTMNSSFNSTILDTNMSILGNFGNGIMEESTPFNSPKKVITTSTPQIGDSTLTNNFTKPKLPIKKPDKLKSLIELTSRIKDKYKN